MSFQLSPNVDENKVFLVNSNDLEDRLDPFFYTPQFEEIIQLNRISKYPVDKVSRLSYLVADGVHKTPDYSDKGLLFLQANNIKEGEINFENNVKRVSNDWREEVLKRYTPEAGDILVTKDGTIGVAATVPSQYIPFSIFVSVLAIRPKKHLILSEYFRIVISSRLGQKQILRSTRGAVLSHLLLEETRELKIPMPPLDEQREIIAKMDAAYAAKKQKEEEAQRLLDSIDDYLLSELGINLPEPEENTIQNRIFYRNLNEITGDRIDPYPYQNKFKYFEQVLKSMPIEVKKLKDIVSFFDYGLMPTQDYAFSEIDGLPMIRVTNIKSDGSVDMSDTKYIKFDTPRLYQKLVKANDILMVQCGNTTGKCAFVTEEYEGYTFGSFSFAIRGNSNFVVQSYLFIAVAT